MLIRFLGALQGEHKAGYDLEVGRVYVALCIYVSQNPQQEFLLKSIDPLFNYKCDVVRYGVVDGMGLLIKVPSKLFELVETKISSLWQMKRYDDGSFLLSHKSFHEPHFFENVSDFDDDAMLALSSEVNRMNMEYKI